MDGLTSKLNGHESAKSLDDVISSAYLQFKEQIHGHEVRDAAISGALVVAATVAFKGKLSEVLPCAQEVFRETEKLSLKAIGHPGEILQSANAELKRMFQHDQASRLAKDADWEAVAGEDRIRRNRVVELMHANEIKTADDFFNAAMIMHHGPGVEDSTLAHVLASTAALKGNKPAVNLVASSFDRMLIHLKLEQVFGTQSRFLSNEILPVNNRLLSDSVRGDFGVEYRAGTHLDVAGLTKTDVN